MLGDERGSGGVDGESLGERRGVQAAPGLLGPQRRTVQHAGRDQHEIERPLGSGGLRDRFDAGFITQVEAPRRLGAARRRVDLRDPRIRAEFGHERGTDAAARAEHERAQAGGEARKIWRLAQRSPCNGRIVITSSAAREDSASASIMGCATSSAAIMRATCTGSTSPHIGV